MPPRFGQEQSEFSKPESTSRAEQSLIDGVDPQTRLPAIAGPSDAPSAMQGGTAQTPARKTDNPLGDR
ncbi:hypothetical protein NJB1907f44_40450 [Mycobacterium marinum]|nr:hypothetical protein NJB1907f34b_04270 [Mycobacterium marinum]GJO01319.1 hypothetical protein NJB1907E90_04770 [Mycobacterium marinum]GJO09221.1 hypothetical protein NJB1808e29_43110 [Mycobacterium marinum]GJO19383.1 hypothetical protein NJB1907E11_25030 [Mycobacterium marinum]GJO27270.1 hypothetical protein NJB1907f22_18250 [Mycobacterium marinum]